MANWRDLCCAAAAGALLAASCLAQSVTITLKQTGNLAGANYSTSGPNMFAGANIAPGNPFEPASANVPDTYLISWSTTNYTTPPTPPNPPVGMISISATALVPAARIKLTPAGGITLDLDVTSPEIVVASKLDCTTLPCVQTKPVSFPLKGTFEWYTGMGSYADSISGTRDTRSIDPNCETNQSFSGRMATGSAVFTGVIGELNITPPPLVSNATMNLNKGALRIHRVCTPPPPPPMP